MSRLDRAEIPDSTPDRSGYVYILCHPQMRDPSGLPILKIGATRKHPIARATELSMGTGVPGAFTVSYYCAVPDAFEVEGATHEAFAEQRVDEGREFFSCRLDEAVLFIRHYVHETFGGIEGEGGEWIDEGGDQGDDALEYGGPPTPFAELFATFPDDGEGRELTDEERARCRELAAR